MHLPLKPPALTPGDVIGIAAPASAFKRAPFERGLDWLRSQGFSLRLAPGLFARHHYLAGTAQSRAADLHALADDPEVSAIFCARGGYGSMQLLPLLDWKRLTSRPRIVMGYSDITPLLAALRDRGGLVCYHGPVMTGLVDVSDEQSRLHLLSTLGGWASPPPPLTGGATVVGGVAEGETLGGNLCMIASTLGTPYQLNVRGRILLLEEVGERPYRVDRMLTQLRLGGFFDGVAGIAVGTTQGCIEPGGGGRAMSELLLDRLGDLGVPVCMGLPFGHSPRNFVVPLGARGLLNADKGTLFFPEPVVAPPRKRTVGAS